MFVDLAEDQIIYWARDASSEDTSSEAMSPSDVARKFGGRVVPRGG